MILMLCLAINGAYRIGPKMGANRLWGAEEFMYHFGKSSASEMDPKFPMMERRAHSWRMAQEDPDQGPEEGAGIVMLR